MKDDGRYQVELARRRPLLRVQLRTPILNEIKRRVVTRRDVCAERMEVHRMDHHEVVKEEKRGEKGSGAKETAKA